MNYYLRKFNNSGILISLILGIGFIVPGQSIAQGNAADSLLSIISSLPDDTSKVNFINRHYHTIFDSDYELGLQLATEAKKIADKIGDQHGLAWSIENMGLYYWYNGYYDQAEALFKQAVETGRGLGDHHLMAETFNRIGLVFYYQAVYDSAKHYHLKALNHFRQMPDSLGVARIWYHIGLLYFHQNKYRQAVDYYLKALDLYESNGSPLNQANMLNKLSEVYQALGQTKLVWEKQQELTELANKEVEKADHTYRGIINGQIGDILFLTHSYDSALIYFEKAMQQYKEMGHVNYYNDACEKIGKIHLSQGDHQTALKYISQVYEFRHENGSRIQKAAAEGNLADVYAGMEKWGKAIAHYTNALNMHLEMGNAISIAKSYTSLAEAYCKSGDYNQTITYALKGLKSSRKISAHDIEIDLLKILSKAYHQKGSYEKAYAFLNEYNNKKDTLTEWKTLQRINHLKLQYNKEKKEREIAQLKQKSILHEAKLQRQKLLIILFFILFVLILSVSVLTYNRYKLKTRNNQLLAKKNDLLKKKNKEGALLLKEIHHRVKNNLQMISSLLSMQNRRVVEPKSKELLNITQNRVKSIGLIHEHLYQHNNLSLIKLNLYVEKLIQMLVDSLYNGTIQPKITLKADAIETTIDQAISIGMILNELVTNAIKYGLSNNPAPKLIIMLKQSENMINIEVSDNGPGISEFKEGFGWTIINTTLENINGTVKTESKNGFTANLTFNLENEF